VNGAFRIVGTEAILRSQVFDVERRMVEHDGSTFERDVVTHRGAVAILAINREGEVGFLRQYRAPFDAFILEIPAGTLDVDGEDRLEAAQRELREELGCDAATWRELGTFMVSPGWTNQVITIYEARELTMVGRRPEGPEETSSSVVWLPVPSIKSTLRREPAIDSTVAVALHRVFGTFFDLD